MRTTLNTKVRLDIHHVVRCMEHAQMVVRSDDPAELERFVHALVAAGDWYVVGRTLSAFGDRFVRALGAYPAAAALVPRAVLPTHVTLGGPLMRGERDPLRWLTMLVLALRRPAAADLLAGVAPPDWMYPPGTLDAALAAQTWRLPTMAPGGAACPVAAAPPTASRRSAMVTLWRARVLAALLVLSDHDHAPEATPLVLATLAALAAYPPGQVHIPLLRSAVGAVSERLGDDQDPLLRRVSHRFALGVLTEDHQPR